MHYFYITNFPRIGSVEIVSDGINICGLRPVEKKEEFQETSVPKPKVIEQCINELNDYFAGERKEFTFPVNQEGTEFQKTVWDELLKIPYGETISYAELAKRVGNPKAARAVGSANGKNNICIVVPCHRVINADGKLGGYAYGLEMKELLLNLEKTHE